MTTKRGLLVGAGALAVASSYILALERGTFSEPDVHTTGVDVRDTSWSAALQPSVASPEARALREVNELTVKMAQLKSELTALRASHQPAPAAAEPPPKTAEQEQAEHDEYMAFVERAFEREPRDEKWAAGTAQMLRQTIESEPLMLAALSSIECHSSSCRVEVRDDGSPTFADEFSLMVHQMGAVLREVRFSQSELGGGAQLHVLYMSNTSTDDL